MSKFDELTALVKTHPLDPVSKSKFRNLVIACRDNEEITFDNAAYILQQYNLRYNSDFLVLKDRKITMEDYIVAMINNAGVRPVSDPSDFFREVMCLGPADAFVDAIILLKNTVANLYGDKGTELIKLLFTVGEYYKQLAPIEQERYDNLIFGFKNAGLLNDTQYMLLRRS